jgi:23S rRNA (uracil1939-C5)-methyltransferase
VETFNLELTKMAHGGAALGRTCGQVVFVSYGLAGDLVRAEITKDKGRYAFARIVEVLKPSGERVEPPCRYFGPLGCGGCQWQHISYDAQRRFKSQIVSDQLQRLGRIANPLVRPTIPDLTGWAYRNHAQFHPAPNGGIGFLRASTTERGRGTEQDVMHIEECLLLHPLLSGLLDSLDLESERLVRVSLRAGISTGDKMVILETEDDQAPILELDIPASCVLLTGGGTPLNLVGRNHIREAVDSHSYRVSAPSFFQVNTNQAAQLVQKVLEYADLRGQEKVLDAYAGVGLFTSHLAEHASLVPAVEANPFAVDDLLVNTETYENVEVIEGPVEAVLADLDPPFHVAVIDPPRSGVHRSALESIVALRPDRVIYVSCDPATLARDAKTLVDSGYELVEVQPVDMFAQTYHVESVAQFVARDS